MLCQHQVVSLNSICGLQFGDLGSDLGAPDLKMISLPSSSFLETIACLESDQSLTYSLSHSLSQSHFSKVLNFYRFLKVLKVFGRFLKVLEGFWRFLKCFWRLWRFLKVSEGFWRFLKVFEGFLKVFSGFWRFWWFLKVFKGYWN